MKIFYKWLILDEMTGGWGDCSIWYTEEQITKVSKELNWIVVKNPNSNPLLITDESGGEITNL